MRAGRVVETYKAGTQLVSRQRYRAQCAAASSHYLKSIALRSVPGSSASCSTDTMRSRRVCPGLGPMICGRRTTARLANARARSRYSARTSPELECRRRSSAQRCSGAHEGDRPHPVHAPAPTAFPLLEPALQVVPPQGEARSVQPRQEQPKDAASHPQRYQASPADQEEPQALRTRCALRRPTPEGGPNRNTTRLQMDSDTLACIAPSPSRIFGKWT